MAARTFPSRPPSFKTDKQIMKKIALSLSLLILGVATAFAQGYKISGTLHNVPDGTLWLVSFETGLLDTLAMAQTRQGHFEFTGRVEAPQVAYITSLTANDAGIPLVLENTDFTVDIGTTVKIKGGPLQDIMNEFTALSEELILKEREAQQQMLVAQQEGNSMKAQAIQSQFNKYLLEMQTRHTALLNKYSDTYVAAYLIMTNMTGVDLAQIKAEYGLLGENAKATLPGRTIATYIAAYEKIAVGNEAPDFTMGTADGLTLTLSEVKAKAKVVYFWVPAHQPCRQENVNYLKLYKRFEKDGLTIIAVALQCNELEWKKAMSEDGIVWESGMDRDGNISRVYFAKTVPYNLLLDENNNIVAINLWGSALQKKVAEMLKGK